jgi:hypothetical protein
MVVARNWRSVPWTTLLSANVKETSLLPRKTILTIRDFFCSDVSGGNRQADGAAREISLISYRFSRAASRGLTPLATVQPCNRYPWSCRCETQRGVVGGVFLKSSHKVRKLRNSNQSELLISMSKSTSPPMDLANALAGRNQSLDVYCGCAVAQLREGLSAAAAFSNGAPTGKIQAARCEAIRLQAHARLKFAPLNASDPRWPPSVRTSLTIYPVYVDCSRPAPGGQFSVPRRRSRKQSSTWKYPTSGAALNMGSNRAIRPCRGAGRK